MGQILKYCVLGWISLFCTCAWAEFDPTAPPQFKKRETQSQNESQLAWVRMNGKHSIAWYGGTAVKLGERVEGGRVVDIHEDHIVIAGPQGRRTISLLSSQIRHQPLTLRRSLKPQQE